MITLKIPQTTYSKEHLSFLKKNDAFCQWKYSTFNCSDLEKSSKKKFWSEPRIENHNV